MSLHYRQKAYNTSYEFLGSLLFSAPKKQAQMPIFRPLVLAKLIALFGVHLKDKALI